MTPIQNAFEGLATEAKQDTLKTAVDLLSTQAKQDSTIAAITALAANVASEITVNAMAELLARQRIMQPTRALQYARDASDQMRVLVGAGTLSQSTTAWANGNVYGAWYTLGGPTSMDAREQQREMSIQTFQTMRQRWTVT